MYGIVNQQKIVKSMTEILNLPQITEKYKLCK